ncbi:PREDICTED: uncharacterized protein LOC105136743 [Populus euphratica]|uniref:Uncharacterized protein LOC105136743 n=1 Tax=Populus euphratica TaxID=75702 RepID=A0AAJ6V2Q7_POPEU|nr:PREDICTED: uncharacterized protein LOC105136743 [Populus euphratica]
MKNKSEHEDDHKHELEILKGVAQSWHAHSVSSTSTSEYDKYRQNFQSKPSRFKLEAMNKSSAKRVERANWDFKQSLWDSYEIVNVYKRLERGLVLDDSFSGVHAQRRVHRKKIESSFPTCLVGKPSKFLSCAFSEKYFHRNLMLQVPALS